MSLYIAHLSSPCNLTSQLQPEQDIFNLVECGLKRIIIRLYSQRPNYHLASIVCPFMSVDLNFFTIKISAKLLNEMEPLDIWEEEIQICTSEVDLLHEGASKGP